MQLVLLKKNGVNPGECGVKIGLVYLMTHQDCDLFCSCVQGVASRGEELPE
jgi:hypothetical protein